ncbi:hypothetical protein GPECTOR_1g425 [Gonium pectorale]|uniref:Transglutaminase-like domain-containing protein n=1 Tax=Gonium pectorale TaxID=33097 RepID=A0A150H361_GONPE|nr:hypothetical protein GPECTOR_1g425 [Gonium pectorale]|eukprot:KXZ56475.1 hypothetical protein GPECTOR_1g425 [Gonium pectorale]
MNKYLEAALEGERRPLYQGTLSEQRMAAMDAHARACPAEAATDIAPLAAYLRSAARNAEEIVRAVCFWLHLNVRYDTEAYFGNNVRSMCAQDVLRERKSVCHGFARLMAELCKACGVECRVIDGYAKGVSWRGGGGGGAADVMPYKSNHNWVAVQLRPVAPAASPSPGGGCASEGPGKDRGRWYLVDPTWCAGCTDPATREWIPKWAPQYYMPAPVALAQSHFPGDPDWTLLPPETRPDWRSFLAAARLGFPASWELGVVPVSHRLALLPAPEDGRLRVVFRKRKGVFMLGKVADKPCVRPTLLRCCDRGEEAELVAFDLDKVGTSSGGGGGGGGGSNHNNGAAITLYFFASPQQYDVPYEQVVEYTVWERADGGQQCA